MSELIGIDTGGTFTDFILYKNGEIVTYKTPSTPEAPEKAILYGLKHLNINHDAVTYVHGTTVATNALLEGKGARTAFITNSGFKDILHIGRQTREDIYSLCPQSPRQLIPQELCFEVNARVNAQGEVLKSLSGQDIEQLRKQLHQHKVESVAISLLFSYLNAEDEIKLESELKETYFTSRSSLIFPEQKEYERGIVTWLNSYLGPLTRLYLQRLQAELKVNSLHVMQSDATTIPAVTAANQAVRLLLSGPAGGVVAAHAIGRDVQSTRLLTIDMGGTSTDVSLIDQQKNFTSEGKVAEYPLAISMLDIHTIGAGGGSIARVDEAGGLHVGPQSAGATPGPAGYGHGGVQPTITDANIVLGRLPILGPWSSGLQLNRDAAKNAIEPLAKKMNCTIQEAANGIISLANAHMSQALRVISIQRGYDPSQFTLFPFGGAAGMHMCNVAEDLGMNKILVPINAGILSAQGMLHAPIGHMASKSICKPVSQFQTGEIEKLIKSLQIQAESTLRRQAIISDRMTCWLDLRYQGQSSSISVQWTEDNSAVVQFQNEHKRRFGYCLAKKNIELVTARVWVIKDVKEIKLHEISSGDQALPVHFVEVDGCDDKVPVYERSQLVVNQELVGPCIILDLSSTHFIAPLWQGKVSNQGHIHLQLTTYRP